MSAEPPIPPVPTSNYPRVGPLEQDVQDAIRILRDQTKKAYLASVCLIIVGIAITILVPNETGGMIGLVLIFGSKAGTAYGAYLHSKYKNVSAGMAILVVVLLDWLGVLGISLSPYRRPEEIAGTRTLKI